MKVDRTLTSAETTLSDRRLVPEGRIQSSPTTKTEAETLQTSVRYSNVQRPREADNLKLLTDVGRGSRV